MKTALTNYLTRNAVTFTVVEDQAPMDSQVALVIRRNYWVDVYVRGTLVKTCTDKVAVRAAINVNL